MNEEELNKILDDHQKWLLEEGGSRADLNCADLRYANLRDADLRYANLRYANLLDADLRYANLRDADLRYANLLDADLRYANLRYANLRYADLRYANLRYANLRDADLRYANLRDADLRYANLLDADLRYANLRYANLRYADLNCADLRYANLRDADYDYSTIGINLACPEEGEFIAFKIAHGCIIKLQVPDDAKRSSATTRKIRVSKAKVLSIVNKSGQNIDFIGSNYDSSFVYTTGETVEVQDFDDNRWNECSHGIHCFLTRHEAEMWR